MDQTLNPATTFDIATVMGQIGAHLKHIYCHDTEAFADWIGDQELPVDILHMLTPSPLVAYHKHWHHLYVNAITMCITR